MRAILQEVLIVIAAIVCAGMVAGRFQNTWASMTIRILIGAYLCYRLALRPLSNKRR